MAAEVDMAPDETIVARLRRLDSCAVSDACDRLGLSDRVADGITPLTGPATVAGRALTVLLGPSDGRPGEHPGRHLCAGAVDAAGPDDVVVVAHQGRSDCAGWGGNLARAAKARGAAATIVDGAVRDVDEAIAIDHPTFATGTTPRTARGRAVERSWAVTVEIAGVTVAPGDYVIADSTGVVFVARADAEGVLHHAEAIAAREAVMAARLDAGDAVSTVMGADYETMLDS